MNDWFQHLSEQGKRAARAEYEAGPQHMDRLSGDAWGRAGGAVVCRGDAAHMRKVAAKMFADKFHGKPCPKGHYTQDQIANWQTVAERIEQ